MKRRRLVIVLSFSFCGVIILWLLLPSCAVAIEGTEWARQITKLGLQSAICDLCLDSRGNIYSAGSFSGLAGFNCDYFTSYSWEPAANKAFIIRSSPTGKPYWRRMIGQHDSSVKIAGIASDPNDCVIAAGSFRGTVDFDPGPGVSDITSKGTRDIFALKLDQTGSLEWILTISGDDFLHVRDLTVVSDGRTFIAGDFTGSVDFPTSPQEIVTSQGDSDCFVMEVSSDGVLDNVLTWGGPGLDWATGIDAGFEGDLYVTGFFSGTVDFDPGSASVMRSAVSYRDLDIFLSKLSSDGELPYCTTWGWSNLETLTEPRVAVDDDGNAYVAGSFTISSHGDTVGSSSGDLIESHGLEDIFLSKVDTDGVHQWTRSWGGRLGDYADDIAVADDGHVWVLGSFQDLVDFDPGTRNAVYGESRKSDRPHDFRSFLSEFDESGNFIDVYIADRRIEYSALQVDADDALYIAFFNYSLPVGCGFAKLRLSE